MFSMMHRDLRQDVPFLKENTLQPRKEHAKYLVPNLPGADVGFVSLTKDIIAYFSQKVKAYFLLKLAKT